MTMYQEEVKAHLQELVAALILNAKAENSAEAMADVIRELAASLGIAVVAFGSWNPVRQHRLYMAAQDLVRQAQNNPHGCAQHLANMEARLRLQGAK